MDNILEKHLVAALLLPKDDVNTLTIPEISENTIPYYSYKKVGNYNYIKLITGLLRTETIGYWKNKPIFHYNNQEYVLLENSKIIVKTESLNITKDQVQKQRDSEFVKQKEKPKIEKSSENTQDKIKNYLIGGGNLQTIQLSPDLGKEPPFEPEIQSKVNDDKLPKNDPTEKSVNKEPNSDVISYYLKNLKNGDSLEELKSDPENTFSAKEQNKPDLMLKDALKDYLEQAKKELYALNEKFSQQHIARVFEGGGGGGGGTNSTQHYKRIYTIGNGIDTDYIIDHNLGTKDIMITLYQGDEVILAYVKNINDNQTLVSFSEPQTDIKVIIFA